MPYLAGFFGLYTRNFTLPLNGTRAVSYTHLDVYKRQGKGNKGYCYVWVEGKAGRGAQEVGSCLLHHIEYNIEKDTEELILWADSCGGQHRNIKLTLMLKAALDL